MTVFVECKPDEALVVALGATKRDVTHYQGKDELMKALLKRQDVTGVVDEDPFSSQPSYLKRMAAGETTDGVRLLTDTQRNHRLLLICPRLEEWLVAAAKESGLSLQNFGFHAVDGYSLHGEINERIGSLQRLITSLLETRNRRLLRLQTLLNE